MFRIVGFTMAAALTTTAVVGIGALILSDFPEVRKALGSLRFFWSEPITTKWPEDVDDINLFLRTPIEGTSLVVKTGVAFSTPENFSQSKPRNYWCYLNYKDGIVTNRLDLGERQGDRSPVYTTGGEIPEAAARDIGIERYQLATIAMSHCKFTDFVLPD